MDALSIHGGVALKGVAEVSGSKNAALPIMAAALLTGGTNVFRNIPQLRDMATMSELLRTMGATVTSRGSTLSIATSGVRNLVAPYELVKTMRASALVLGPLVARYGAARVSLPGGCAIGARPINLHLAGLTAMGAAIDLDDGYVTATAKRLHGTEFSFDITTVGGTETLMMAASLAEGRTTLVNAACEPEIEELARVLNKMGARIEGAGTTVVTIDGVDELRPVEHAIIADRIEAATLLIAAAATRGDVVVRNVALEHMESVVSFLREMGVVIDSSERGVRVRAKGDLDAVDIQTLPFPGYPTDLQAQGMALLTTARGTALVTETIYENRFMHVSELQRMGANIAVRGATAAVTGVARLKAAPLMATDIRASASLVIAALMAEERTVVSRIYHLDRGYEALEKKLRALGARIRRVKGTL